MNTLAKAEPRALTSGALVDAAKDFMNASRAPATRRAYRQQWSTFREWAQRHGLECLPAHPNTVVLYLTARANGGAKVATIEQALAAIFAAHEAARLQSPTDSAEVRAVRRGIRRTLGVAPVQKSPLLVPALKAMVGRPPANLTEARDKALLLLGFAGAFRRSELVGLQVDGLRFDSDGLRVRLLRSKTDQDGHGETVLIPFGEHPLTCPVRALRAWVDSAQLTNGCLFRGIGKGQRLKQAGLTGRAVALIVKRHVGAAGLDASLYSGHSLRSGLATAAAKAGKSFGEIKTQTRHKDLRQVHHYIQDAQGFEHNAAKGIGL